MYQDANQTTSTDMWENSIESMPSQGRGNDTPGELRTITKNPNNILRLGPMVSRHRK